MSVFFVTNLLLSQSSPKEHTLSILNGKTTFDRKECLTLPDKPLLQLFWSRVMQHLTLRMSLLRRIDVTNSYYYSWWRKFGSLSLAGEKQELCSWELMQAHMESLFYKKLLNITNNCIIDHISLKQIIFIFFCGGGEKKEKRKKQVLILPITKGFSATSSNTNAIMT